jgi:hypothetical protein
MTDDADWDEPEPTDVLDRDGVRVLAARCPTCIFRPGNLMRLERGRIADMVATCLRDDGHIPCHETLSLPKQAICRGFWDAYGQRVTIGQLAHRLNHWKEIPL